MLLLPLADVRKRLLWWWTGFTIPILVLFFLQAVNGKFAEIEGIAWMWLGINALPGLLILLVGSIQNKNAGKLIQVSVFRVILIATIVYLVLLLVTLLTMAARAGDQSIAQFFLASYRWLAPIQLILVVVFGILYYKKDNLFQPNEKIMKKHLSAQADKAKIDQHPVQEKAFEQLRNGNYEALFGFLRQKFQSHPENTSIFNEIILLESQYIAWKRQTEFDVADPKEARRTLNRLTLALINIISGIPK